MFILDGDACGCVSGATLGANTVVLTVTDSNSGSSTANLTVNVTANTAPTLTYTTTQSVVFGQSANYSPTAATDNGSITGFSVLAGHGLTTPPTVNSSGVVSVTNAGPVGAYTVTIRATDNCGAMTDSAFTLNVAKANPTTTVMTPAPGSAAFNSTFNVAATASSGLAVAITTSGAFSWSQTVAQAGSYTMTFAVTDAGGASDAETVIINVTNTNTSSNITVSAPTFVAQGSSLTLSGILTDAANMPLSNRTVTFSIGGPATQICTATTNESGTASCAITSIDQPVGLDLPVQAKFAGDGIYSPSSTSTTILIFAYVVGNGGGFVIGDVNAVVGQTVTFWGSQWGSHNTLSAGSAPISFKGFANRSSTTPMSAGATWFTDPGNSSNPPATVPAYMALIVSSSITKSGATISGNTQKVVIVRTNPGYDPAPGHNGTGTIVGVLSP